MSDATATEVCIVACAEAFRGDGEILASPMGDVPSRGAALARATFAPDLMIEYVRYRTIFDIVWAGKRHVMMGASQIDRFGNQNISCIGDVAAPKVQLLGVRGAPGNTINHTTSYWIPKHNRRVFVDKVDVVCGVGYDRAAELGEVAARFHEIRCVISDLGVFDFQTPDRRMRLASLHPGVELDQVRDNTGFDLVIGDQVPTTRMPTDAELALLREETP